MSASPLSDSGNDTYNLHPNDPPILSGGTFDNPSEEMIIKATIETYQHEYEIRKPHETLWDRVWRRVQNRYDFTRKSRWQSQKSLPAITILAFKLAWELTKALEMAGDNWFEVETGEPDWQPLLDVPRDLVREFMNSTGSDPENNFLNVFFQAIFFGIITGQVYIRVTAEDDGYIDMTEEPGMASPANISQENDFFTSLPNFGFGAIGSNGPSPEIPSLPDKTGFRIRFDAMNPRFMFKDTASRRRPRYLIHQQSMTRGEYREEAEARGWRYTEEVCKSQMGTGSNTLYSERNKDTVEKDLAKDPKRLDTTYLTHYYGNLYDGLGNQLVKDSYFIMANNMFIVWGPEPLPYWHKQIPITAGSTLKLPGVPYSKSILELNVEGQEASVEIMNMLFDYLNQAINPPTEVDVDQLNAVRPNQLNTGIFPGKVLEVQKGNNPGPAVARSAMPDVSSGVWQGLGFLKQALTEFTGMADTGAMPRTRNRISAKEFSERAAASNGINQSVSKNLERDVLEPVLWQAYMLGLQKWPQEMWEAFIDRKRSALKNRTRTIPPGAAPPNPAPDRLAPENTPPPAVAGNRPKATPQPPPQTPQTPQVEQPGGPPAPESENPALDARLQEMRSWGPEKRFLELGTKFKFRVKVYTALESRREKLEQLSQFVQMAEAMPALASRAKWHEIAEDMARALELDPERYLWPNSGETADAMAPVSKDVMALRPPSLIPTMAPNMPPGAHY